MDRANQDDVSASGKIVAGGSHMKRLWLLVVLVSSVASAETGLVFPANPASWPGDPGEIYAFIFDTSLLPQFGTDHGGTPQQGVTFMWEISINDPLHDCYSVTFFYAHNGLFDSPYYDFYGAHPYPHRNDPLQHGCGPDLDVHKWEMSNGIGGSPNDDLNTDKGSSVNVVAGVWHTQAVVITNNGSNNMTGEFYLDLPNVDPIDIISRTGDMTMADPASPAIYFGDAPWAFQFDRNERCNCTLRNVRIFDAALSEADLIANADSDTLVGTTPQNFVWYHRADMSPDAAGDGIEDTSGNANHPEWVDTSFLPTLFESTTGSALGAGGDLLWEDVVDGAGSQDRVLAVAAKGRSVFSAGDSVNAVSPTSGFDWRVRANDAKTGALRWQRLIDVANGVDGADLIAVRGRIVIVAGTAENAATPISGSDWLIRAFDGKTGADLWQITFDGLNGSDGISAIALKGRTLIAVGAATNAVSPTSGKDWLVRAYSAKTGTFLWEDRVDLAGGSDGATVLAVKGRTVFVGGNTSNAVTPTSGTDWLTRAYDIKTGNALWQTLLDMGRGTRGVAVSGRVVVQCGFSGPGVSEWLVQAYDAKTGTPLWQDRSGGRFGLCHAVAAKGRAVYVVGTARDAVSPNSQSDWFIRAYDAKTGDTLWEDAIDKGDGEEDEALTVLVKGRAVYVAGYVTESVSPTSDEDWFIRAYDAKTGKVLWDHTLDKGEDDEALALAVAGRSLVVGGYGRNIVSPTSHLDWLYQALSLK